MQGVRAIPRQREGTLGRRFGTWRCIPWGAPLLLLLACSSSSSNSPSSTDSGTGVESCSSCSANQLCVTVLGGQPSGCAVIPNDAGCPPGMVMDGTFCVAVAYQCVAMPACDSGPECVCSLCPCDAGACTPTGTGVTCNCLGP
jgi:hypothetical protein